MIVNRNYKILFNFCGPLFLQIAEKKEASFSRKKVFWSLRMGKSVVQYTISQNGRCGYALPEMRAGDGRRSGFLPGLLAGYGQAPGRPQCGGVRSQKGNIKKKKKSIPQAPTLPGRTNSETETEGTAADGTDDSAVCIGGCHDCHSVSGVSAVSVPERTELPQRGYDHHRGNFRGGDTVNVSRETDIAPPLPQCFT